MCTLTVQTTKYRKLTRTLGLDRISGSCQEPDIRSNPRVRVSPAKLLRDTGYLMFSLLTLSLTVLCNLCSQSSHIAVQASALVAYIRPE